MPTQQISTRLEDVPLLDEAAKELSITRADIIRECIRSRLYPWLTVNQTILDTMERIGREHSAIKKQ